MNNRKKSDKIIAHKIYPYVKLIEGEDEKKKKKKYNLKYNLPIIKFLAVYYCQLKICNNKKKSSNYYF